MDQFKFISRVVDCSGKAKETRTAVLAGLLLVLLTAAAFWPVLDCDFINFDDPQYVTQNPHVRLGLTAEGIAWAFSATEASNWHPLTWLSHMLDCQFYGLNPKGHHFTNLLLHVSNVLLLFWIFKRMTGDMWRSFLLAALFAVHPLRVESVAWIAERKDLLCTFWGLIAVAAYVLYAEKPSKTWYLSMIFALALGLMAKPMLVTLPFALILLDYWPLCRLDLGQRDATSCRDSQDSQRCKRPRVPFHQIITEKIPLFALVAASSVITYYVQRSGGATLSLKSLPIWTRVSGSLVAYVAYIGKAAWPQELALPYPYAVYSSWQTATAGIMLLLITVVVLATARRLPHLVVGWFWFLGTLVPVIGLVTIGSQAMADRYTYLTTIGLVIMVVWCLPSLHGEWSIKNLLFTGLTGVLLLTLVVWTQLQVRYWKNSLSLFEHALEVTTGNYAAHINVGSVLLSEGKLQEATVHFEKALELYPKSEAAYNNLGLIAKTQGQNQQAIQYYTKALQVRPDSTEAHFNMGFIYFKEGNVDEALAHFGEAVRVAPQFAAAHDYIGNILAQQGKFGEAAVHFIKELQVDPHNGELRYKLGVALERSGKPSEALVQYTEALRVEPNLANAHYRVGVILAGYGKLKESMVHFSEALQLQPNFEKARKDMEMVRQKMNQSKE